MLRWLNRLFRQREAVETASPATPAPPVEPATAVPLDRAVTSEGQAAAAGPPSEPEKETCPTCGRTSVFAGPPGQRFCTYCALRDELFEAKAAANE